jgi:type VI secretion system protein ImpH
MTIYEHPLVYDLLAALGAAQRSGGPRLPDGAPCRFLGSAALTPASSEVVAARPPDGARPMEMTLPFPSLFGWDGPLPYAWTEELIWAQAPALRDFLDCFNHPLMWQHGRARALAHPESATEAGEIAGATLIRLAEGLLGVALPTGLPKTLLVRYFSLFQQIPSRAAMESLLSDYFDVPVRAAPVRRVWRRLTAAQAARVGFTQIDEPLGGLQLRVGPMSRARYEAFVPGGGALRPLLQLARLFAGPAVQVEARLHLAGTEQPETLVGPGPAADRLAYLSWLPATAGTAPAGWFGRVAPPVCAAVEDGTWSRKEEMP